jgi:hypothetical protein
MKSKIYTCDECPKIRCTIFVTYLDKEETVFGEIPMECILRPIGSKRIAKWIENKAYL